MGEHVHETCVSSPDEKHAGLEQSQTASTREYQQKINYLVALLSIGNCVPCCLNMSK